MRTRLKNVFCVLNVMAHAQKPDFAFLRNGRGHLNRQGRKFSRLLAAVMCASAVVMLDTPCSEVVWRVLATHCIRKFPLHFPYRASPCTITLQLGSTNWNQRRPSEREYLTAQVSVFTIIQSKVAELQKVWEMLYFYLITFTSLANFLYVPRAFAEDFDWTMNTQNKENARQFDFL